MENVRPKKSSNLGTIILIIIIIIIFIILLGLFIWLIIIQINLSSVQITGPQWRLVYGSTNQVSDNIPGGGGTLFIAQSDQQGYIGIIGANSSSSSGQNIWIKNNTINTITLSTANGVTLETSNLSNTVAPGATAQLVYTGVNNLLRLN